MANTKSQAFSAAASSDTDPLYIRISSFRRILRVTPDLLVGSGVNPGSVLTAESGAPSFST